MATFDVKQLANKVITGDRRALAKAITLVESTTPGDRRLAAELLVELHDHAERKPALRIGITGVPGVGKSSLLGRYGTFLVEQDSACKLGVIAVDPSSSLSSGSLLGDKIRMGPLAAHSGAFLRAVPSGSAMGGIGAHVHESILILEAAGLNPILVESVGSGQSEFVLRQVVDVFVLVKMPATGDDIQAHKKGINEMADVVVVNKNDGVLASAARDLYASERALGLDANVPTILTSALDSTWCREFDKAIRDVSKRASPTLREEQRRFWFQVTLECLFREALCEQRFESTIAPYREAVASGMEPARSAAASALGRMLGQDE
jgi:LAO/AO transport system kinase